MKTDERNKFAIKSFLGEYLDLKKDKDNELATVDSIRKGVEFKGANLWILIFAIFMASLGLNVNSTAVIIGAMLISPLMGPIMSLPGQHGNIVQLVMNRLKAGQEIRVVSDQWRTPTYVGDVSDGVLRLIEHTANGIFHICGDECMTIAEIAYQVADYMKLDRSLIHPTTTEEMNESTPRPRFSGMSIDKARTMLGYRPQKLKEILANWDKL